MIYFLLVIFWLPKLMIQISATELETINPMVKRKLGALLDFVNINRSMYGKRAALDYVIRTWCTSVPVQFDSFI